MVKSFVTLFVFCLLGTGSATAGVYEDVLAAAYNQKTDEVIELLHRGLDVNTADRDGSTLLLIAARTGNLKLVEFLLSNRASLAKPNRYRDTAILSASIQGHTQIVVRLLDAGAEINPDGWAPLHYAVFGNHLDIIKILIHRGADVDQLAPNRQTSLMIAASQGHLKVVELLLAADADTDIVDADNLTAEALALKRNNVSIAKVLREASQ